MQFFFQTVFIYFKKRAAGSAFTVNILLWYLLN